MSDIAQIVMLMLMTQTGDGLSMTRIRDYPTMEACRTAADAITTAVGEAPGIHFGCVSGEAIQTFGKAVQ